MASLGEVLWFQDVIHQKCLHLWVFLVQVVAPEAQVVDDIVQTKLKRQHHGGVTLAVSVVVQLLLDFITNHFDHGLLSSSDCNEDWGKVSTDLVLEINFGFGVDQKLGTVQAFVFDGEVKRPDARCGCLVDISSIFVELLQQLDVTLGSSDANRRNPVCLGLVNRKLDADKFFDYFKLLAFDCQMHDVAAVGVLLEDVNASLHQALHYGDVAVVGSHEECIHAVPVALVQIDGLVLEHNIQKSQVTLCTGGQQRKCAVLRHFKVQVSRSWPVELRKRIDINLLDSDHDAGLSLSQGQVSLVPCLFGTVTNLNPH